MPLTLSLPDLASRATRTSVTGTPGGIRRIAFNAIQTIEGDDGPSSIWDGLGRVVGSIFFNTINNKYRELFSFSVSKIFSILVSTGLYIFNFNWNTSNAELDAQIKQAEIGLATARGALKGGALGYAICGLIPTATIAVFNEPLALYVLKELGEEAAEEITANAANLINLTMQQTVRKGFAEIYKNHRNFLRPAALGAAALAVRAGVITQESLDKATKERNKPWSFAIALENSIESIKDPIAQAEAEEFWDELFDSCIEAGYIVAGGIDSYFAQSKLSNDGLLGEERLIRIEVDRSQNNTLPATT